MGREIRRVPPPDVWLHPTQVRTYQWPRPHTVTEPVPLVDQSHREALAEYETDIANGGDWMYENGPPSDDGHYRPHWADDERTWFQLYETVREGTPLSPPFPTKDMLKAWLITYGDDGERRSAARENRAVRLPSPEGVARLVDDEWAPTMTASSVVDATGKTVGYTDLKDAYGAAVVSKR